MERFCLVRYSAIPPDENAQASRAIDRNRTRRVLPLTNCLQP